MKFLSIGETFVNSTGKDIFYMVKYLNALGYYQESTETLKPTQSITRTGNSNKVVIFLKP